MSVSIPQFWTLAQQSQLLTEEECRRLGGDYQSLRGARRSSNCRALAAWLVSQHALTNYQAKVLLSGRAGPFRFGAYQINDRAGGSSASLRFRAVHLQTHHRVLLHIHTDEAPAAWRAARAQMERHLTLMHPHLDRCYEVVEQSPRNFAVTEDVDGQSIERCLQRGRRFPVDEACRIVHQVAQALSHLHVAQLVHGRLTSSEVVLQSTGHVKLLRHPLLVAKPLSERPANASAAWLRLADYLAPELWQPAAVADSRADLYALGCLLYELIAAEVPFAGGDLASKIRRHTEQAVRPLEDFRPVPPGLTKLVSFMMAKRSELRYQDAAEVAGHLENYLDHSRQQTHPKSRPTEAFYLGQLQDGDEQVPRHLRTEATRQANPPRPFAATPPPAIPPTAAAAAGRSPSTPPPLTARFTAAGRPKRPRRRALSLMACGVTGLLLLLGAGLWQYWGRAARPATVPRSAQPEPTAGNPLSNVPRSSTNVTEAVAGTTVTAQRAGPELIDDDGRTLWQSPTAGEQLSLQYAPPEARMFLVVRPRAILATPEGPRVLQAMGPAVAQAREQFESQTGIPLDGVERLTLAYIPLDVGPPRVTCVVELAEGVSLPTTAQSAGESVPGGLSLSLGDRSGFLPAAQPRILVWGDPIDVAAVISADGSPPLLRRELDRLAQVSDCERHLTLLLTPNFLAADGRDVLSRTAAKLREPILELLGDGVQAVSLSLHLGDSFYGELRFVSTLDRVPLELAADCQQRLRLVPEQVNDYLGMVPIDAFWQKLAVRLPLMVNYLFQQTRIGVSDDCAVMNFMLPTHAAHNLCLASELAMAAQVMPATRPADDQRPSVADPSRILNHRMALEVPQQSLDFALRDLASLVNDEIPGARFEIRIQGQDLQLDGITRNQQIRDLKLPDATVGEILTEIVSRANPVRVTAPSDAMQKLVWVVDSSPSNAGPVVLITTRAAAGRRGETLPAPFVRPGTERVEKPPLTQ